MQLYFNYLITALNGNENILNSRKPGTKPGTITLHSYTKLKKKRKMLVYRKTILHKNELNPYYLIFENRMQSKKLQMKENK